ncbi:hypothetical protein EVAR_54053_1 [Eumeta japonica]|uniref:Uncharacterized protein n=1 Tax=Eumeta variegata TaxID=151549 RepID=A0A4C1XF23_EUMVA|nr:hypothetical protein EVAR_54053_1 [Eumeta japonica]
MLLIFDVATVASTRRNQTPPAVNDFPSTCVGARALRQRRALLRNSSYLILSAHVGGDVGKKPLAAAGNLDGRHVFGLKFGVRIRTELDPSFARQRRTDASVSGVISTV